MSLAFWYWPEADGPCRMVDAGQRVSRIQEIPTETAVEVRAADDTRFFYGATSGLRVRIVHQFSVRTTAGAALARQLHALETHLRHGGWCAMAGEQGKAWASWVGYRTGGSFGRVAAARSKVVLPHTGNFWSRIAPTAALAAGDEVVIEEARPPAPRRQQSVCYDISATEVELLDTEPLVFDYEWAFLRHRDFYPALYLPQDGEFTVSNDARIVASLTMELQVDYAAMEEFGRVAEGRPLPLRGLTTEGPGSLSIEEILRRGAARDGSRATPTRFGSPLPWR